jgi:hypothetical protein
MTTKQYCSDQTTVTIAVSDFTSEAELSSSSPSVSKQKGLRRKRSSKRKTKKANRDHLVGLIAQEVTSTWNEDQYDAVQPTRGTMLAEDPVPPVRSAADIFYVQINGESLQSDPSMHSGSVQNTVTEIVEDNEDINFPHHMSFANLDLPEELQDEASEARRIVPDELSFSHRSKDSLGSASSGSSSESSEDNFAMQDIQDIVMAQMPEKIKSKIPKEAWERIFGPTAADMTRKPVTVPVEEDTQDDQAIDDDDSSVISDITMHTTGLSGSKKQVAPIAPGGHQRFELAMDVFGSYEKDLCPILPSRSGHGSIAASRDSEDRSFQSSKKVSMDGSVQNSTSPSTSSGVRFGNVQVRYYERVMEVNPSVTSGVAIGIGWNYKRGGTLRVDDWENQRGRNPRASNELVIPRHLRDIMLKELGYTQQDFAAATRIILKAKHERKTTVQNHGHQKMEEAVENAARRVKGLLSFGRNKGLV